MRFYNPRSVPPAPWHWNLASRSICKIRSAVRWAYHRESHTREYSFPVWNFQDLPVYNFQANGVSFSKFKTRNRSDGVLTLRPTLHKRTLDQLWWHHDQESSYHWRRHQSGSERNFLNDVTSISSRYLRDIRCVHILFLNLNYWWLEERCPFFGPRMCLEFPSIACAVKEGKRRGRKEK